MYEDFKKGSSQLEIGTRKIKDAVYSFATRVWKPWDNAKRKDYLF